MIEARRMRRVRTSGNWRKLGSKLDESLSLPDVRRIFDLVALAAPMLTRFSDARSVVAYLGNQREPAEDRRARYAVLVRAAQRGGSLGELATVLMLVSPWKPLTRIYRQLSGALWVDEDDVASEIVTQFVEQVSRIRLRKVDRIAPTLLLNVRRDTVNRLSKRTQSFEEPQKPSNLTRVIESTQSTLCETELTYHWLATLQAALPTTDWAFLLSAATETADETCRRFHLAPAAFRKRIERLRGKLAKTSVIDSDTLGLVDPSSSPKEPGAILSGKPQPRLNSAA
jgi:RNA polymerase sigma-70 factor (ECF subfamily)